MKQQTPSLLFCVTMDLAGYFSYSILLLGEFTDIIWAPVSAIVFYHTFGRKSFGRQGAVFAFLEELLPGADFIPTFTIAWVIKKVIRKSESTIGYSGLKYQ